MKKAMVVGVLLITAVLCFAQEKEHDPDVVGKWQGDIGTAIWTLYFNADGTFVRYIDGRSKTEGTWYSDDGYIITEDEILGSLGYQYRWDGGTLLLTDPSRWGEMERTFKRVK